MRSNYFNLNEFLLESEKEVNSVNTLLGYNPIEIVEPAML